MKKFFSGILLMLGFVVFVGCGAALHEQNHDFSAMSMAEIENLLYDIANNRLGSGDTLESIEYQFDGHEYRIEIIIQLAANANPIERAEEVSFDIARDIHGMYGFYAFFDLLFIDVDDNESTFLGFGSIASDEHIDEFHFVNMLAIRQTGHDAFMEFLQNTSYAHSLEFTINGTDSISIENNSSANSEYIGLLYANYLRERMMNQSPMFFLLSAEVNIYEDGILMGTAEWSGRAEEDAYWDNWGTDVDISYYSITWNPEPHVLAHDELDAEQVIATEGDIQGAIVVWNNISFELPDGWEFDDEDDLAFVSPFTGELSITLTTPQNTNEDEDIPFAVFSNRLSSFVSDISGLDIADAETFYIENMPYHTWMSNHYDIPFDGLLAVASLITNTQQFMILNSIVMAYPEDRLYSHTSEVINFISSIRFLTE